MPKMREHRMAVTVKASPFLSASQVRREVRYSIKEGVGYMAYGPDFQEVKVSVGKVGPMPKAAPQVEPPRLPRAFLAGRAAFFKGEPLVQALAYGNEHQNDAWRAGWYAGHVQSFQDGAAAALETENPQPQFSPSWEAWGAGYNATQWGA